MATHFAFGSYALTKHAQSALRAFARRATVLNGHVLSVLGYTDYVGSAAYNVWLSRERASAVGDFLKTQLRRMGYHSFTLYELGKGVTRISSNRALDRTVTISY
jgi:flagellar motor protein MotB